MKKRFHDLLQGILNWIGIGIVLLFLISFGATDKLLNGGEAYIPPTMLLTLWGLCTVAGLLIIGSKMAVKSLFGDKSSPEKPYNKDEVWAIKNNWCLKCFGIKSSDCPHYNPKSKSSLYRHGVRVTTKSIGRRPDWFKNPHLAEQEERTRKELKKLLNELDK